jgi:hypothetical protein
LMISRASMEWSGNASHHRVVPANAGTHTA